MIIAVYNAIQVNSERRPERDLNPNLFDITTVLYQLSYQAFWKPLSKLVHHRMDPLKMKAVVQYV